MSQLPKLEIADSGAILAFSGPAGQPLLAIFDDSHLTIEIERDEVKLSTALRDKSGAISAELVRNEWKVNPQKSFDRNYSRNAIEVRDSSAEVVLQARVLKDRVQFAGRFYGIDGSVVAIGKVRGPDGKIGGGIEVKPPGVPVLLRIPPLFRYPSDLHLGEYVTKRRRR